MGYLYHEAVLVYGGQEKAVLEARTMAAAKFNAAGHGALVSGIVTNTISGGGGFFILPDGSKEGWDDSTACGNARWEVIAYLRTTNLNWMHVNIGGDDRRFSILNSPENDQ